MEEIFRDVLKKEGGEELLEKALKEKVSRRMPVTNFFTRNGNEKETLLNGARP